MKDLLIDQIRHSVRLGNAGQRDYAEVAVALASIQLLLKENESELLKERRSTDRKPFVRPVVIATGRNHEKLVDAFSRDISLIGIGLVSPSNLPPGTLAVLTIHSLGRQVVRVTAEVRWCQAYGDGWFLSGWSFMGEST